MDALEHEAPGADVAILGAGMAGLMAARTLSEAGHSVVVFDKGRGVGGRMATRRFGDVVLDHGAQYFTARDPRFREQVETWVRAGWIRLWSDGFATADGAVNRNGEARYIGSGGMTALPKRLAEGLSVVTAATAVACRWLGDRWEVSFKERPSIRAKALVLTAPVPQTLALLAAGEVPLTDRARGSLSRIEYAPCLAALVHLDGPSRIPAPGGLWLEGEPVTWLADNTQKGISPVGLGAAVTIHAGPEYSREHWHADPETTARALAGAVADWLGAGIKGVQLHRWRYATPRVPHPDRCLAIEGTGPLVVGGDAFGGPRVEGAALSGMEAGAQIVERLRALGG